MDTRKTVGIGGLGVDLMSGAALAYTSHAWLWVPFAMGAFMCAYSLWPIIPERLVSGRVAFGRIPLEDAARLAYEAAERVDALDMVSSQQLAPQVRLNHFKYVFMADDETVFYGVAPPSTRSLPIPRAKLKELYPMDDHNQLNFINPFDRIAYVGVKIRRKDLQRIIKQYPAQAKRFAAMLE